MTRQQAQYAYRELALWYWRLMHIRKSFVVPHFVAVAFFELNNALGVKEGAD